MQDRFKFRFWDEIGKEYKRGYCVSADGFRVNNIVPEQCIGLKDKHGNLIYEGDWLKDENGCYCYVVWFMNGFWVKSPVSEALDFEKRDFYEKCEIIGNIHENHELLEKE